MNETEGFDPYFQWLDIDPRERPVDHYCLLGLDRFEADVQAIARAADRRMSLVRSFQTGPRGRFTQRLLNELAQAKLCLLDPRAKAAYDAGLQNPSPTMNSFEPLAPPVSRSVAMPPPVVDSPWDQAPSTAATSAMPLPPPVADGAVAASGQTATSAEASDAPVDVTSFYRRPWFWLAVAGGVVVVAGMVWGVGRIVQRAASDSASAGESTDGDGSSPRPDESGESKSGRPTVAIEQASDGSLTFPSSLATIASATARLDTIDGTTVIRHLATPDDRLTWTFNISDPHPGPFKFKIEITYAAPQSSEDGQFEIVVGDHKATGSVRVGSAPTTFVTDEKFIFVSRRGENTLEFRPLEVPGDELMSLREIRLVPLKR